MLLTVATSFISSCSLSSYSWIAAVTWSVFLLVMKILLDKKLVIHELHCNL